MLDDIPVVPLPVGEYFLLDQLVAFLGIVICILEPLVGGFIMLVVLDHVVAKVGEHLKDLGRIENTAVPVLPGQAVQFEGTMVMPLIFFIFLFAEMLFVHADYVGIRIVMMSGMVRVVGVLGCIGKVGKHLVELERHRQ